jgi:hypothetical protein
MSRRPAYQYWVPAAPSYAIESVLPGFETPEEVEARSAKQIRILRNGPKNCHWVADELMQCSDQTPCDSPACPICMRQVRRWLTGEMLSCFEKRHDLLSVTIVPAGGAIPDSDLPAFNLRKFINTTRKQLHRLKLPHFHAVIAVDVTYDVEKVTWYFHLHIITVGIDKPTLMHALKHIYPVTEGIRRPIVIKSVCDRPRQFSYILKSIWRRKEHYLSPNERRTTKEYPLRGRELRRLMQFLDRYTPTNLIILFHAEFGAGGQLRLK